MRMSLAAPAATPIPICRKPSSITTRSRATRSRARGIDTLTSDRRPNALDWNMQPISYARHRFPPDVIRRAVWLYLRFTLSYRDVEDVLAERGLMVSNESIRRWVLKFGPIIAKNLREIRPKAHNRWHLDEMVVSIAGRQMYMWRAVDGEGEVLEIRH